MEKYLLIGAVFGLALYICAHVSYKIGHLRGYGAGAKKVLGEWKKYMNMEETNNE